MDEPIKEIGMLASNNADTQYRSSSMELSDANSSAGFRTFFVIWLGQFVSTLGSALTEFGLGVWVYQRTGSVMQYTMIIVFAVLPGILFAPLLSGLIDRFNRTTVMRIADSIAAICACTVALLLWIGRLETWHIFVVNAIVSVCQAIHRSSYQAAIAQLLPKEKLGAASGMMQMSLAVSQLLAPVLAASLVSAIGLLGIITLDLVSFLFAVITLTRARVPSIKPDTCLSDARAAWKRDFYSALHFLSGRPELKILMFYFFLQNFLLGLVMSLVTPMALALYSELVLARILTAAGIGAVAGSLAVSIFGIPRRLIIGILAFEFALGLLVAAAGIVTSPVWLSVFAFGAMYCVPMINGADQVFWQNKVPFQLQGRVFLLRDVASIGALPAAALIGGPLAEYFFEPLLLPGGVLADSAGLLFGVGPGRGVGMLFTTAGLLMASLAILALAFSSLRHLDNTLPDAH